MRADGTTVTRITTTEALNYKKEAALWIYTLPPKLAEPVYIGGASDRPRRAAAQPLTASMALGAALGQNLQQAQALLGLSDAANMTEGGPLLLKLPRAHDIRESLRVRPRTGQQLSEMPVALRVLAVPGDKGECVFTSLLLAHKTRDPAREPQLPSLAELKQFWLPILATLESAHAPELGRFWNDVAYRTLLDRNRLRPDVVVTPAMGAEALQNEIIKPLKALCGLGGNTNPSGTTDLLLTIVSHVLDVDIVHMKLNVDTTPATGTRTWAHSSLFTSRLPEADLNKAGLLAAGQRGLADQGHRRESYKRPEDRSLRAFIRSLS